MAGHILHLAMVAALQPALQVQFILGQIGAADTGLGETQFDRPALDISRQGGIVGWGR